MRCHISRHISCFKMRAVPQRERLKRAESSLSALKMRIAPQRERIETPNAHRVRFALSKCAPRHCESDSTHTKCAEGSPWALRMRTAPQRERFDPPKVCKGFTHLAFSSLHCAAARASRPILTVPRLPSLRPSAKVLRLPQNCSKKCCACHAK